MVAKKKKPDAFVDQVLAQQAAEASADREYKLRLAVEAAKADAKRIEKQRKLAVAEAEEARQALSVALSVAKHKHRELAIKPRERSSRVHEATAVLLYSDLHPDEVVTPDTVAGLNEFNLEIARERNSRLARAVLWNLEAIREHEGRAGYRIRDFILAMLGDLISNTIHPELMESNSLLPAEALLEVETLCCEVIDALLSDDQLESIYVPACHGNHDRMTPKVRHQTKAGNSLAWILYHHLASLYYNEPRVRFDIARGNMVYTDVYGRSIRWTHGDDIRYNGGVLGVGVPMQKAIDAWDQSRSAYLTCCGHYHTFSEHRKYVMNGSLIGYTAYAQSLKARAEPASQAMFLIDKDYGKGWVKPILLQGKGAW